MSREWKPGDVAMVTDRSGSEEIGYCYRRGVVGGAGYGRWAHWRVGSGEVWSSVVKARPLVVIDPEDREAVERLGMALIHSLDFADGSVLGDAVKAALADTLQAFVTPPRPDEPTGLGAVVEDADGNRWVRVDDPSHSWVKSLRDEGAYTQRERWDTLAAVRVLSEGVTE